MCKVLSFYWPARPALSSQLRCAPSIGRGDRGRARRGTGRPSRRQQRTGQMPSRFRLVTTLYIENSYPKWCPATMPRKGIHPLMRSMTVVLRNGSSFQACTALNRKTPWKMQMVRRWH